VRFFALRSRSPPRTN